MTAVQNNALTGLIPAKLISIPSNDFAATVQIHAPLAMLVIAKRFEGKGQQERFFFGKHGGDLSLRGAMNAGVSTACLPTIQIGLGFLQALKAFSLERSLGVADARLNFSFAQSRQLHMI